MPQFTTTQPVALVLDVSVGNFRISASDRGDTIVEVTPTNPSRQADVTAAEETTVELTDRTLRITGVKQPRMMGKIRSVDIHIQLPAGSTVTGESDLGTFTATGHLAGCEYRTASGDISVGHVDRAEVVTKLGDIQLGTVTVSANLNSAKGNLRVERAVTGTVDAITSYGDIDIAVSPGSAVQLTTRTAMGTVHNGLSDGEGPRSGGDAVIVNATTSLGDISVRRAA